MQLSLQADYSCRVLIYLSVKGERCSIEEIATAYNISKNHLVKLVHELGKLGYIATTRGRGGGIQLAKSADLINIGEVIRKMEPNLEIVECFNSKTNSCPITGACGLKPWLIKATNAFLETLDEITVADAANGHAKIKQALNFNS